MESHQLIHQLMLRNFLSYGSDGVTIDLHPLNVLIGPNASGKSNLIEAIGVLRGAAKDLTAHFRERGGIREFMRGDVVSPEIAEIETVVDGPDHASGVPLLHRLHFHALGVHLGIFDEEIQFIPEPDEDIGSFPEPVYDFQGGDPILSRYVGHNKPWELEHVEGLKFNQSILSQRSDPRSYPDAYYLADHFSKIAIYQDWTFGGRSRARLAQGADMPSDFLLPDASNLALVVNQLTQRSQMRDKLLSYLKRFYEAAQHITTTIEGGSVQLYIEEVGGRLVPATRLSDGTLRYLSLLTILCHPSPPRLICIEEPELGLHPDVVPTIAELLKEASERTQLVVTTHSDALVSALSDVPESVIVCEPGSEGTTLRRLDPEKLAAWLEKYTLGELWLSGEIGGTRW